MSLRLCYFALSLAWIGTSSGVDPYLMKNILNFGY